MALKDLMGNLHSVTQVLDEVTNCGTSGSTWS